MKKVISAVIAIMLICSAAIAYTVTVKTGGITGIFSSETGNIINIIPKGDIGEWMVESGDATIVENKFTMPEGDVVITTVEETSSIAIEDIPVGAYIAYTPAAGTVTVLGTDSGTGVDQTFSTGDYQHGWKVMYNNDGQLDIISAESVVDELIIGTDTEREISTDAVEIDKMRLGIAKAPYTLNKMCNEYATGQFAVSGRSLGSAGGGADNLIGQTVNGYQITIDDISHTGLRRLVDAGKLTVGSDDLVSYPYTGIYDMDRWNTEISLINSTPSLLHSSDVSNAVWLAYRTAFSNSDESYFRVNFIASEGDDGRCGFGGASNGYAYCLSIACGVRPVVSLKSGLKVVSGSGTKEDPYVLGADAGYQESHTITFNNNGGTGSASSISVINGNSVNLSQYAPTKQGYEFTGWATAEDGSVEYGKTESIIPTGNMTLYARWSANTYTITYNGNGSTGGSMASSTHTYGEEEELTVNSFTKTGYIFEGWSTSANGAVEYSDGQVITNLSTGSAVTLYAKWADSTYTINTEPQQAAAKLQEAINKASDGKTITLTKDIADNEIVTVPVEISLTLDLAGKTITTTAEPFITVNGTLTIIDSVGGGKIVSSANEGKVIEVADRGTITILGGSIEATGTNSTAIYGVVGSKITLGTQDGVVSESVLSINATNCGVLSGGDVNFYDGIVVGGSQSVHANVITEEGYVFTEEKPEDEVVANYVTNGLTRYFDANQNAGQNTYSASSTIFADLTGKSIGTVNGATWNGNKLTFDGTNDWVNLGAHNPSYVTVEALFEVDTLASSNSEPILSNETQGGYKLHSGSDGKIAFAAYAGGTAKYATLPEPIECGRVYHAIGTYDGANVKLYIDGNLVSSTPATGAIKAPTNDDVLAMGANPEGNAAWSATHFDGSIYMARVYNRGITAEEALQNYNSLSNPTTVVPATGPATGRIVAKYVATNLKKHYDASQNAGLGTYNPSTTTFTDLAGTYNGKINGATWDDKKLSFDGNDWVNLGVTNYPNMTVEAVFSPDKINGDFQYVIGNAQSGGYILGMQHTGCLRFDVYIDGTYRCAYADYIVEPGKVYHFAGTFDGTSLKLYINGELVKTTSYAGTMTNPGNSTVLAMGANPSGTSADGNWLIGDVYLARIYNRAITAEEVKNNYLAAMLSADTLHTGGTLENGGVCTSCGMQYIKNTVTYNYNGGTGAVETDEVELSGSCTLPYAYREGYTFSGWYDALTGGNLVGTIGDAYIPQNDITLYALWGSELSNIPVGSYISYRPSSTSVTISSSDSGIANNQTYNPSNYTSWKVFKNDNGQIEIISSNSVGSLSIKGKTGYANALYTFNKMCKAYVNAAYAVSGRCLGYVEGSSVDKLSTSLMTWTYTYKQGNKGLPFNDTYYLDDYNRIETAIDGKYPLRTTDKVWLASRKLFTSSDRSRFFVRYINGTPLAEWYPYGHDNAGDTAIYTRTSGIRPVIKLKSCLEIVSGDGTSASPYVLQLKEGAKTVTYNYNGGTSKIVGDSTLGSLVLPTTTKTNYVFSGWYDALDGGNLVGVGGATYSPTADITLYAHWEPYTEVWSFSGNTWNVYSDSGCTNGIGTIEPATLTLHILDTGMAQILESTQAVTGSSNQVVGAYIKGFKNSVYWTKH